jgi:hypothetical protein
MRAVQEVSRELLARLGQRRSGCRSNDSSTPRHLAEDRPQSLGRAGRVGTAGMGRAPDTERQLDTAPREGPDSGETQDRRVKRATGMVGAGGAVRQSQRGHRSLFSLVAYLDTIKLAGALDLG